MAAGIASTPVEAIPAAMTPLPSVQRNRRIAKAVPLPGGPGGQRHPGGFQGEALILLAFTQLPWADCQERLPLRRASRTLGRNNARSSQAMNGAESLVHTLLKSGVDTCFSNPGTSEMHFVAALDRVPGMRCVLGLVRGRGDRRGRRLRAHGRQAGGDAAALRPRPGERPGQPAQRAPRQHADRQHPRRPGDLSPAARRAADRGHRGLGARRLRLGAHRHIVAHGRRRRGGGGAGGAHLAGPDRHADPAVRHVLGRRRRGRRGAAGARRAHVARRARSTRPPTILRRGGAGVLLLLSGTGVVRARPGTTRTASPRTPAAG